MSDFTTWRSLVDGEEIGAIPDPVEYQLVAEDYDDDAGEWDASDGSLTMVDIGSPTKNEDDVNGLASITLDGTDDGFQEDTGGAVSLKQPYAFVAVVNMAVSGSNSNNGHYIADAEEGPEGGSGSIFAAIDGDNNDGAAVFADSWMVGSDLGTAWVIVSGVFNGPDSEIRINKSVDVTGDPGSRDFEDMVIGMRASDLDANFLDGKIAELQVLDTDEGVADAENFLDGKYNIT